VRAMVATRALFRAIALPPHVKPAIAGVLVGVIALAFPQVLGTSYGWLQFAIAGDTARLGTGTMLALVAAKIAATSLTVGSGGSGGFFAHGLFVGGMVGAVMWSTLHARVPGMPPVADPFVVVGMGALFGGIAKAPIAVMLMVAEMTGEFTMIVPAMIAVSLAYIVAGNTTIYDSQVPTRADSPAHRGEYTIPLIQTLSVGQAMERDVPAVAPDDAIDAAERLLEERELRAVPVVAAGRLVGIVTSPDVLRARVEGRARAGEAMRERPIVAYPTDGLHTALQRMVRAAISALPVVDRRRPDRLLGLLRMTDLARVLDAEVGALASRPEGVRSAADDPLRYVAVEEAMSRPFVSVREDEPLAAVVARLSSTADHAALVVDAGGALVGIVTTTDLARGAAGALAEAPVSEVATRRVVTAHVGQLIADALAQPGAESARQLPVIGERDGCRVPLGLLRRSVVVVAYLRGRERLASASARARARAERAGRGDRGADRAPGPRERHDARGAAAPGRGRRHRRRARRRGARAARAAADARRRSRAHPLVVVPRVAAAASPRSRPATPRGPRRSRRARRRPRPARRRGCARPAPPR